MAPVVWMGKVSRMVPPGTDLGEEPTVESAKKLKKKKNKALRQS